MITIKKVTTAKELTSFIDFQYELFEGNPCYVPPLFIDEYNTLDKKKNAAFGFCEAEYFLAYNEAGKVVGRIAGIINHRANEKWNRKYVRFGWFDFIDDREVSDKLLAAVEDFGRSHGMEKIIGPFGFTDLDKEGMLTEGFDRLGTMMTSYAAPYYKEHMHAKEGYGIEVKYRETLLMCPEKVPEKYIKVGQIVQKRYNLHVYKPSRWNLIVQGEGRKIFKLINDTYADLYGYNELDDKQIDQYIAQYIPFVKPSMITIVRDHNTPDKKMVGFGLSIPSLSYAMQKTKKGRLLPFGWWHIVKTLFFQRKFKIVDLLLIGVLPEYRSKGANALMFTDLIPQYIKYGVEWAETQVQLEDNEHAISQWDALENIAPKRRECYSKML